MKIGIDGSCILSQKTGIGYFTQSLLMELLSLETKHEFTLFLNSYHHPLPKLEFLGKSHINLKHFRIPGPLLIRAWRYLRFPPIEFLTGFLDLFHSPTGYIPPQIHGKRIATVYDLFFMKHPELCDKLGGRYYAKVLPKRLPRFDHIIVPSIATKHDLKEILGICEEKITVIYGGVDQQRFHIISDQDMLETFRQEYCLPRNHILSVSTIEPRKNLEGLLIAYRRLKEILFHPPKLVIVGREGLDSARIKSMVRQHGLSQDVLFTGYIPEEHIALIYNSALIFVYPSLWEGFGLPVLEAMACGVPCLISNTPALREVSGESALFMDPYNYYEMAEKMKDLITSHSLREQLERKGLSHIQKYTWKLTAQKTLRVYEKVMGIG